MMVDHYLSSGIIYRPAQPDDHQDLAEAMQGNPMDGWVRVSLVHALDEAIGKELMGEGHLFVARQEAAPHDLVGMYSYACLPVYLNGQADHLGYLGALRVNPGFRNRLRILKHGFSSLRALAQPCAPHAYAFTVVASQNSRARRLLEAGLPGMPVYQPYGEIETLAISTRRGKDGGLLRRATRSDLDALIEFYNRYAKDYQFAPVLSAAWLLQEAPRKKLSISDFWLFEQQGKIAGCFAIWDQRAFKQTLIQGYRFPLNATRLLYNAWAALSRNPSLPRPGSDLNQIYLAFVAFSREAFHLSAELIREGLAKARHTGASVAIFALSVEHPLRERICKEFHPRKYSSMIETVHWPSDLAPRLDGRPAQPEVAIL